MDPAEQMAAYLKDFLTIENASAIKSTSGGMGKKDDSQNASVNKAMEP